MVFVVECQELTWRYLLLDVGSTILDPDPGQKLSPFEVFCSSNVDSRFYENIIYLLFIELRFLITSEKLEELASARFWELIFFQTCEK